MASNSSLGMLSSQLERDVSGITDKLCSDLEQLFSRGVKVQYLIFRGNASRRKKFLRL
jgi:hypothetical protein